MSEQQQKKNPQVTAHIYKQAQPVKKAEHATNIDSTATTGSDWITKHVDQRGLKMLVDNSTILPQCITAYQANIAGFGIDLRYIGDPDEETSEMKAEWDAAKRVLDLLTVEGDTKELFEKVIGARETYGVGYLEVIRSLDGNVAEIAFVRDVETIEMSVPMGEPVEYTYHYRGEEVKRKKRFRKYRQSKNGKTVYFKEFGDPRVMDMATGTYKNDTAITDRANELLEFALGSEDYGLVRWMGQIKGVEGSDKAENLNLNYFENGRHTPLAIVVSGGTLSQDSHEALKQYINGIKGEAGQHSFLLLEVEDEGEVSTGLEVEKKPAVELKDMASILQKDELFQGYIDNSRRKVQSAFRLPDIYVGYTTDFNRATAQSAIEITEQQVFQPERAALAWIVNNKLLNCYGFKYVEAYFKEPDMSDPEAVAALLDIAERAGGLSMNDAHRLALETLGWGVSEDYEGEMGKLPLAALTYSQGSTPPPVETQLEDAIEKAEGEGYEDVADILRDVRALLRERETDDE